MILNLFSVFIIAVCIIYLITIAHEIFVFYVKDLVRETMVQCKEQDKERLKAEARAVLQNKKLKEEEEKKIRAMVESFLQKQHTIETDE